MRLTPSDVSVAPVTASHSDAGFFTSDFFFTAMAIS